jgi:GNAT superfamily N-acetyltransferase
MTVQVTPARLADIQAAHLLIPEFQPTPADFWERVAHVDDFQAFTATMDSQVVGYTCGYAQEGAFYCWLAGVVPAARSHGVLSALLEALQAYARQQGYAQFTIQTRNNRREMLQFLVKRGYLVVDFLAKENINKNRILFMKEL